MRPFPCLVLTPWMGLHQVKPWQWAISAQYAGQIAVIESYEETASSPSITIQFPAVGRITKSMAYDKHDVKYSRANVYARDGYRCQYCGKVPEPKNRNLDHVVPRSRGGKTTFENVVTSCRHPCNDKKGSRTPKEAGMRLLRTPETPRSLPMSSSPILLPREVPAIWLPYLNGKVSGARAAG